jgi:hypothetical protein
MQGSDCQRWIGMKHLVKGSEPGVGYGIPPAEMNIPQDAEKLTSLLTHDSTRTKVSPQLRFQKGYFLGVIREARVLRSCLAPTITRHEGHAMAQHTSAKLHPTI